MSKFIIDCFCNGARILSEVKMRTVWGLTILCIVGSVQSAEVKWSAEQLASDGSNILAFGTEHVGVSYGSSSGDSRIINGVDFKAYDWAGNHDNPNWSGWIDNRNGSATRYGVAGDDLKELTNDIVYGDTLVLGINNLTVGHTYRIQLISYDAANWWNNPEAARERWQTITATGDTGFSYQHGTDGPYSDIDDVGAVLVIGTWTADSTQIDFTINGLDGEPGNINDNAIINGFVVQKIISDAGSIDGYNWSDTRDNFIDGLIMPSGIYSGITDATLDATVAGVCDALIIDGWANTIRFGINPQTVADTYWWGRYKRMIAQCQRKGMNVILACWEAGSSKDGMIDDYALWKTMWQTVDAEFEDDGTIFFEPFNEPHGYSKNDWLNIVQDFRNFTYKPENRILVGGTGWSEDVSAIGGDSRVGNCWFSLHIYAWFGSFTSESIWEWRLGWVVGNYADRTIMTEFGVPATTGKDYSTSASDSEISFMRGISRKANDLNIGCCYWPGIRDGDSFRMFTTVFDPQVTNWSLMHELRGAFGYYY